MLLKYGVYYNYYTHRLRSFILIKVIRINKNIFDRIFLHLIYISHTTNLFKHNYILKCDDLLISRYILNLYNLIQENYNIDIKSYLL